jgi:radical SAM-linked protein
VLNNNRGDAAGVAESGARDGGSEAFLLVIEFKVGGNLRFLSHAEMLKVFQRACVRAGLEVNYSQGFNPRPRMSLPLPKPVGVESEHDLLCLRINKRASTQEHERVGKLCDSVETGLAKQLPEGIQLLSVYVADRNSSFQPIIATYVFPVQPELIDRRLKERIEILLASESLIVNRVAGPDRQQAGRKAKSLDVRDFLQSIKLAKEDIVVECKISPAGSIRVDEILTLLELDEERLAGPVRRTKIKWQVSR